MRILVGARSPTVGRLNSTVADVRTCYHTDFNVPRVSGWGMSAWINDAVRGIRSLVVSGSHVGPIGGYLGEHDRIVIGHLTDWYF